MPATVALHQVLTVVHKTSDGIVMFMPDVCLTPAPPAPPIPIPYPNIAMSQDTANGSKSVTADGNPIMLQGSFFSKSTGDEAGSVGGVMSGIIKGKAKFISYAFDVLVEGQNVPRLGDLMLGNEGATVNTPPMPVVQPPLVVVDLDLGEEEPDKMAIILVDGAGQPVQDAAYRLELPDGQKLEGKTDGSGKVKIDQCVSGAGRLVFPDLDGVETAEP
jgi:hypothetical protein